MKSKERKKTSRVRDAGKGIQKKQKTRQERKSTRRTKQRPRP